MAQAFVTSVASNLTSKLGEYLFVPIGRQFGYVLCYKCYIEDLENGVKELEHARKRVQSSVDEAIYDGKLIHADVEDWLEGGEKKAKEAENLLKCGASAKNDCFRGWLPNPMVRHPIGKKVKKMTQVIHKLHEKSQNNNFLKVYYENPPIGIVTGTTPTARSVDNKEDVLESRAKITEEVIKAIVDDNVCVLGAWGVGGVGKSKLLEDVKRRVEHDKMFDVVAMANVSLNLDLKRIQGEIAYALGLKLMNEETARGRADLLCKRIERDHNKSILIILDNLWKKLDLKEVGIPCGDNNKVKHCKLLIASRYRDVLRIDMSSDREVQLNELEHREARRIFERTVGDKVNNPDFTSLVDKVIKNCGGLPLLIVSLAKRLKHGDLAAWRTASAKIDLSDVESLVKLNYNDLKDERIRSLFLICALVSGRIFLKDSLVYGMGLGLFEKFSNTIETARDRLIVDLHSLQDSSLLLDSDLQDSSLLLDSDNMKTFRMHDIFVDVAISISSIELNALVGRKDFGFKEWTNDELRKCTAISILFVGIDELPKKLDCPNLRMLLLGEHNPSLKVPELFLESMTKLQVLDFTGLYFTSLPSSIEFLENLKSLCLYECHLEDVTVLGKLKGLQFLNLQGSTIALLPEQIGELTKLRLLDLTSCAKLKVIKPGVLGSLVNLEELYMEDGFDKWEAEDEAPRSNASLAELKNMKKLSTLSIAIPHYTKLSRDLPFGKLKKHKIHIGDVWDWLGKYKESRTLKLKLDSSNLFIEEWMLNCLHKTQDLHLDGLRHGVDSIRDLCIEGFPELKHLHIQNSPSFQNVVCSIGNVKCTTVTGLESLFLENLNNLKKICHGCLALESFRKLKILKVDNCGEITHLFPLSIKRTILPLEEIEISSCHLMQQVVADAEADEDGDEIYDDTKVKLCNLRRLTLRNLPEMMSFCKTADQSIDFFNGQQVSLPWLESLTLSALPILKEIWNSEFPSDVSNLKFLKVEDCAFLMSIFPSNLLIKLHNLEAIIIERCQVIRKLFDLEGLTASGDVEILSRLTTLTLSDLPRLEHIWNKNPRAALCFRNLRVLKVQGCENLRLIFSSSMAKALQQIKEIRIARCKLLEEIMDVQEEESKKAASMHTLEFPLLSSLSLEELPNLRTFSHGTHRIHCPTLTRLRISGCPRMMTFSSFEGKQQMIIANTSLQQALGGVNSSLSLPILFDQNILFPSLEELTVVSCGLMKIWHDELSKDSFCKLASIIIQDCENLSQIFPSNVIEVFQSLKMIEVVNCPSLESLMEHVAVNTKKRPKHPVFLNLNEVKLRDLPRLDALVTSSSQVTLSLPSLTTVSLRNCHSMRYLFTYDTSGTLDKLEMLDVSYCNKMQEVVAMEENEEQKLKAVKFSHLCTLKLYSLKSLISFSSRTCAYEFPSLRNLSILKCTELKAFILGLPAPRVETMNEGSSSYDESPHSLFSKKVVFPNLKELHLIAIQSRVLWENEMPNESICELKVLVVKQCPNLLNVIPSFTWKRLLQSMESLIVEECPRVRNLFTMSMAKSLVQLKYLGLGGCGEMEYIVAKEEEKPEEAPDIIEIPQLVTLYLHKMIKLRSFCHGKHISEWPSLKEFNIEDCKAVEVILGDASCRRLQDSIPMQQPLLLVEKVEFPSMESMKISHMDNMEKIWLDELPSNAFTKLKKLIVEYCEKLSSIFSSDSILMRFRNLEKLKVTNCGSLEVVFQIQELNLGGTHSTSTFQLRKLHLEQLPKMKHVWSGHPCGTLTFEHLRCLETKNCESLKSLFPISVAKSMTRLELLQDCGLEEIIREEDGVGMSASDLFFPQLTHLTLHELPELRSFYRNSHTSTWPLLKELMVRHCNKMKSFSFTCEFQSCQGTTTIENQSALFSFAKVIPHLELLELTREDVAMLPQHYIFGSLKNLILGCYHDENVAFPSDFLLQGFPNLEHLVVICSSFEEIFPEDARGHGGATPCEGLTNVDKPLKSLGNLKELWLINLCNLRRFWKDGSLMAKILKQIELLYFRLCPSLLIVFPSPASFRRLTQLEVEDCAGLVHMGTSFAMTSLVHLTWLTLRDCGAMEDVVTDYGDGAEEIPFPKLEELILDRLPSLESFSPTNYAFSFPSLKRIVITQCPKMNIFCKGALRTPNVDKVLLSEEDDEGLWEVDLNTTIRTLSTWNDPQ